MSDCIAGECTVVAEEKGEREDGYRMKKSEVTVKSTVINKQTL
jgi:hypothetical protein